MTIEKIRETIKVHAQAAEQHGKPEAAWALVGLLTAIDEELLQDGFFNPPPENHQAGGHQPNKSVDVMGIPLDTASQAVYALI